MPKKKSPIPPDGTLQNRNIEIPTVVFSTWGHKPLDTCTRRTNTQLIDS